MDIKLSDQLEEKDFKPLFTIEIEAFKNDPVVPCLYPGGLDKDHIAANVELFKTVLTKGPREKLNVKASHGDVPIAFIHCRVYRGKHGMIDDGKGNIAPLPPPEKFPWIDEKNRAWIEWINHAGVERLRAIEELQMPLLYVQILSTDPKWQRHGLGTMLLEWVFKWMEKEGLTRCALDTNKQNVDSGFYQHRGFRIVEHRTFFDKERFPDKEKIVSYILVRDS